VQCLTTNVCVADIGFPPLQTLPLGREQPLHTVKSADGLWSCLQSHPCCVTLHEKFQCHPLTIATGVSWSKHINFPSLTLSRYIRISSPDGRSIQGALCKNELLGSFKTIFVKLKTRDCDGRHHNLLEAMRIWLSF